MKNAKTNAMRILERSKIDYEAVFYDLGDIPFSGAAVAEITGVPEGQCFKTLTVKGDKNDYFVFVIPVSDELDLKKAAAAAGCKRAEMVHVSELEKITGYIRGEVSPVGMKKTYPTYIEESALNYDKIVVSAGKKGASVRLAPRSLAGILDGSFASLAK